MLMFHKDALTDAVYEFRDDVLTFNAAKLALLLADVSSKLFNLLVADAVNVLSDPVLTLNADMEACCDPELTFKFSTLALTELV